MEKSTIINRLLELIDPVCSGAGYELVDVEYVRGPQGWVLRVFIDLPQADAHVGFADCERVSRELSAVLDVEDPLPHAYSLEVSSPGVERPLRTAEHFARFVGEQAKISLHAPIDGRRNFKGTLVSVQTASAGADSATLILNVEGTEFRLPLEDIATARLVPNWDALLASAPKLNQQDTQARAGKN